MQSAAAYVRVSTNEQVVHGVSLDAQLERIRAYATLAGLELVAIIREEGVSGSKALFTRPGGKELDRLVISGRVQHIVCLRLDRAFRNAGDALTTTETWAKRGVALHLTDMAGMSLSTAGPMGRFVLCMLAGCAELERNLTAERTSLALQHLKSQGVQLGAPAMAEEATVARILELRAQNCTYREIAATLTEEGFATLRGGKWAAQTIKKIVDRAAA